MIAALLDLPVMVKVLGSLALILVANRLLNRLFVSVLIGTLALAVWCGHPAGQIARISWERVASANNLFLVCIVLQVIWLSSQMRATGVMADLVTSVRARLSQRGSMAVLPAVIGLLPMPGGALFSAPLVDSCDPDGAVLPQVKTQTNHWFRHMWEFWWPLYPGVLLAMEMTGLEVWQWAAVGLPLMAVGLAAGYVFVLRRIDQGTDPAPAGDADGPPPPFFRLVLPIFVVVLGYAAVRLGYAGLRRFWPDIIAMDRYFPMMMGLVGAMLVLQVERPLAWAQWRKMLLSRRALTMVAIVVAVRVYGAFVEARMPDGTVLAVQMREELTGWGVPLVLVPMVLPFICGLTTGLAVAFVGASFPIVMGMLGADPSALVVMNSAMLAYAFGHAGMMLSPVHVCLVVTNEHFGTRLARSALALARPEAMVLAFATVVHFVAGGLL